MENAGKSCVFLFNPTCEYEVANGNASWQPNRLLQKMENDLATLPMFFGQKNDLILVDKIPGADFLHSFHKLGVQLPEFEKRENTKNAALLNRTFHKLIPWGWSPRVHKLLNPLKPNCSEEFKKSPVYGWKHEYRELYSKKFALEILNQLIVDFPEKKFIAQTQTGKVCTSLQEVEKLLNRWGKLMVKSPWGSSGRGLQPITKTPVHEKVWEKISGIITDQGYVIIEPFLNKVMDLAFQFELAKQQVNFLGTTCFLTDKKGQYSGNYLNGIPNSNFPEIYELLTTGAEKIVQPLKTVIGRSNLASNYEGTFGVDVLFFIDENEEIKVNPCLEINVRKNMGLLSIYLEKLIDARQPGMFKTYYNKEITFFRFKQKLEKKHP